MDTIRAALGYETQAEADKQTAGDQLGEIASGNQGTSSSVPHGGQAPQYTSGNTTSGTEPISGQLGSGAAGEPYDAGNEEGLAGYGGTSSTGTSGLASGLSGHSSRGTGYEGTSGIGGNNTSGHGNNSTLSGLASSLTGNSQNTSGYGNNSSTTGSDLTGHSNRGQDYENTFGLSGNSAPTVGTGHYDNTNSGYSGSSVPNPDVAGYESTSGYGNNTGYDQSTSRGLGAGSEQQANHYTSSAVAGKLPSALGMDAVHQVGDTSERSSNTHHGHHGHHGTHGRESNLGQGYEQGNTHRHGNTHGSTGGAIHQDTSSGYGRSLLGSDRGAGTTGDRYLFNEHTAPGGGGRHRGVIDDFTDANIHHEGAGGIQEGVGSDANAGRAIAGAANTSLSSPNTGSHSSGLESNKGKERARKPGYGRMGSNIGTNNYGLNSGRSSAPRESIGQKLENKVEQYAPAAGVAGAGAAGYGATRHQQSATEPLSGQRGSGVAGAPYDQGNNYDGTGLTGRDKLERKAEEYAPVAGAAGYSTNNSRSDIGLTGRETQRDADQGYGNDGVSQATSGVRGMNIRDGHQGADRNGAYGNSSNTVVTPDGVPYPGRNQNAQGTGLTNSSDNFSKSQDAGLTGVGLVGAGAAASGPGSHHQHGTVTGSRDNSSSAYGAGLQERFAGAPPTDNCEGAHHNAHPHGEAAHVDGTHKPTFLDYQNDNFGIPIARDAEATSGNDRL